MKGWAGSVFHPGIILIHKRNDFAQLVAGVFDRVGLSPISPHPESPLSDLRAPYGGILADLRQCLRPDRRQRLALAQLVSERDRRHLDRR